jgi:septum formation protein
VTVARENAVRKARTVPGEVVLGVDTVVASGGRLWGKPAGEAAAREALEHLSGRTHDVVSGLALVRGGEVTATTAVTRVTFRALDEALVRWYLARREWEGRAGGYAIQLAGAALVRAVEGDYLNVVGLPVAALVDLWPGILEMAHR